MLLAGAVGCHHPAPEAVRPLPARPSVADVRSDLPAVEPTPIAFDLSRLPNVDLKTITRPAGFSYRGLDEPACLRLAAWNTSAANLLDDENRVPDRGDATGCAAERVRRDLRYYTALELRNQSAAEALDRLFRLADAEARAGLARESHPILSDLWQKAAAAKKSDVRYPLDPADAERQLSQLVAQLEQGEAAVRVLNIDLRRRLGLPPSSDERLWPTADLGIDPTPVDAESAVTAAMADRPELRAWRTLYMGLSAETLPAVREQLRGVNPLAGAAAAAGADLPHATRLLLALAKCLGHRRGPDPADEAELEVRRKQLWDLIADRERAVADEARAAAAGLNAQSVRVALARDRADASKSRLDEAIRQRDAKLPGAELLEAQARIDWLKARSELVTEVTAWHQARVRLKAAQGWLAWEAAPSTR
jgi:hypothetical protein